MTAAELFRKEMEQDAPFTKQEFIEVVSIALRKNGRYSYTIDARTSKGSLKSGTIPVKYHGLIRKWATEEGFTITRYTNYFGIAEYEITL